MIALDVETHSLFCLTHLFVVSALRMLNVCFALMMVRFIQGGTKVMHYFESVITLTFNKFFYFFSEFCR